MLRWGQPCEMNFGMNHAHPRRTIAHSTCSKVLSTIVMSIIQVVQHSTMFLLEYTVSTLLFTSRYSFSLPVLMCYIKTLPVYLPSINDCITINTTFMPYDEYLVA